MLWLKMALERKLRKYRVLLNKTSFTVIFCSPIGCKQRVPKPDMHSMERTEFI